MKNGFKFLIIGSCLLLNTYCFGQDLPAFTNEVILWTCPNDTSLKITYRYSNYANIIEINGPLTMDTASAISGMIKISDGSFEQKQLTPQQQAEQILNKTEYQTQNVQQKAMTINSGFFSQQIFYYNTNTKPTVTFDGNCIDAKTKQLNKNLQMSPKRKQELLEKMEEDKGKTTPKTKTANGGVRG